MIVSQSLEGPVACIPDVCLFSFPACILSICSGFNPRTLRDLWRWGFLLALADTVILQVMTFIQQPIKMQIKVLESVELVGVAGSLEQAG
jgi:hypothetical protein